MFNFWQELKRRNVIKAAIAYMAISWLILQVLSIVLPSIDAPEWVMQLVMLFMAIGFPLWIFFSWVYEITPEGLVKTSKVDRDKSITDQTNKRLNVFIALALIAILTLTLFSPKTELFKNNDGLYAIAVLYFDNMSADIENDWISEGMTESISTKLEHNKNLLVSGRTSVKQFKDSDESIPEIAKKLGVSYVLEGSVRAHNDKALITAQLINKNDEHVWAKEYNVSLENILDVQTTIASKIVEELSLALTPDEKKELEYKITDNLEAYKLFVKGKELADTRTKENIKSAFNLFEKAIQLDSLFAEAYAELGHMEYWLAFHGINDKEKAQQRIKTLSDKAISINPMISRAYSILALRMVLMDQSSSNWEEYKAYFEKALELNPNDTTVLMQLADFYITRDIKKSLELISKALKINPLSVAVNRANIFILLRDDQIELAETYFDRTKHLYDDDLKTRLINELTLTRAEVISKNNKDWNEAVKILHKAQDKYPENDRIARELGIAYDAILNDDDKFLMYLNKAYEIDSTKLLNVIGLSQALIESGKFKEAELMMNGNNFTSIIPEYGQKDTYWYYYYQKGDYKKSQSILIDSMFDSHIHNKALNMAQLGLVDELNMMLDNFEVDNTTKAFIYAILKERDSMYHYLYKDDVNSQYINSRFEFDPYRKEERFKGFLKKNYLPLTHWNK